MARESNKKQNRGSTYQRKTCTAGLRKHNRSVTKFLTPWTIIRSPTLVKVQDLHRSPSILLNGFQVSFAQIESVSFMCGSIFRITFCARYALEDFTSFPLNSDRMRRRADVYRDPRTSSNERQHVASLYPATRHITLSSTARSYIGYCRFVK